MTQQKHKFLFASLSLLAVLCVFIFVGAYTSIFGNFSVTIIKSLHLPVGISGKDVFFFKDLSKSYGLDEGSDWHLQTRAEIKSAILEYHKHNINSQIFSILKFQEKKCTEWQVEPLECLEFAWVANRKAHTESYALAENILQKEQSGEDFGTLAQKYSKDDATKIFLGDAGFVDLEEVLPEFADGVRQMLSGETSIVPDRHGLHIIKISEIITEEKTLRPLYRLYDIFIGEEQGFDSWYKTESAKIHLWSFVN